MNSQKIGNLIKSLRLERNMTQREVGDAVNVSDRTVSKWECGAGCPDITLLTSLSKLFLIDIESLLSGNLIKDEKQGGNMRRIKFFACPQCGNIITSTGDAIISCCARKLEALSVLNNTNDELVEFSENEDEIFLKVNHEMTKENYIRFVAWVSIDTCILKKLYPEQEPFVLFPKVNKGNWFICDSSNNLIKINR
jgi:transcriptional regulator with XRE-family HTH domain